ncbi:hypothetical protein ACRRTK_024968 [Alexandromys fortis]
MRGGGRPFGGPPLSGFEGLFVAGIGGSHPLGTLERREERREEEEELDRLHPPTRSDGVSAWTRRVTLLGP